jgi:hypothetical protein
VSGKAALAIKKESPWLRKVGAFGLPVISGVSGTAARMVTAFRWLNHPDVTEKEFAVAVIAWLGAAEDHSLYEIVRGFEIGGIQLTKTPVSEIASAEELYEELRAAGINMPDYDYFSTMREKA